jgi:H+-transporting ATPase
MRSTWHPGTHENFHLGKSGEVDIMKPNTDQPRTPDSKPASKPNGKTPESKPAAKDDLKTMPMAEVEKKLGSSPDGLTQAEAQKRLTQYGPNEIKEEKTNPILKFLTYFWGPIPWMIEVAVILSAVVGHWEDFGIILFLLVCNAVVGQRHRRPEGQTCNQGPGQAGWEVDQPSGA